jgi:hypothetical protein
LNRTDLPKKYFPDSYRTLQGAYPSWVSQTGGAAQKARSAPGLLYDAYGVSVCGLRPLLQYLVAALPR